MPFVWCLGYVATRRSGGHRANASLRSVLGPALGGALAQPALNYPSLFARGSLFDAYPFLLPNLVCVCILGCGLVIGTLFLKETHAEHKHRRDAGVELGDWILKKMMGVSEAEGTKEKADVKDAGELEKLLMEHPPSYRSSESSGLRPSMSDVRDLKSRRPIGSGKAFTKQVVMNIVGYGIMA